MLPTINPCTILAEPHRPHNPASEGTPKSPRPVHVLVELLLDVETGIVVGAERWVSLIVGNAIVPAVEGDRAVGHAKAIPGRC